MTFEELKNNEKLSIYLTSTDTVLFVKKPEYAKKIDEILDRRCLEKYKVDFQRMINNQTITTDTRNAYMKGKKDEFTKDNILAVIEENGSWIDVEKYLLTTAYRIKNLLSLLEDPKNKAVFPHFDDFLPYRKTFAETVQEIDRLLQGKNVVISHKAKHGRDAEGYWDDLTQSFVDVHYTSEELSRDVKEGPIKRALELESHVTQSELESFFSEVRTIPTDNPDVAPDDFRAYIEQMAANNPNIKLVNVGDMPRTFKAPTSGNMFKALRYIKSAQEQNERENNLISNSFKNNGIFNVGKDRFIAVYDGEELELDFDFIEGMREGTRIDLEEHRDSLIGDFSPDDACAIIYKYDSIAILGMQEDPVVLQILFEITKKIIERGENDFDFYEEYLYNFSDGIRYLKEHITYETAEKVTPRTYIRKYGQQDAVKRKYEDLLRLHREKVIRLYQYAFMPLDVLIEDGAITTEIGHKELFEYLDSEKLDVMAVRAAIMANVGLDYKDKKSTDDYIANLYKLSKADKKKRNSYVSRKYLEIIPKAKVLEMFIDEDGIIENIDLRRLKITPEDVLNINVELLIRGLKSGKLPENLRPTEDAILSRYGLGLFREEILDLENSNVISGKSVLELFVSRKSVNQTNPEDAIRVQDVLDFYSVERLMSLKSEGKINSRFSIMFNEEVLNKLDEETRKEYIGKIISDLKAIDEKEKSESPKYLVKLYELYELGLIDKSDIDAEFSDEKVEELLMDDVINEDSVVKYFNDGFVGRDILKEVFSDRELRNLVITGELAPKAILAVDSKRDEVIRELLQNESIVVLDIIDMYFEEEGGLNILELENVLEGQEINDGELVDLIPDDADVEKISEMFKKYLISQDDLGMLVRRGVLSAEKEKELSDYLNSHQEFEKIFGATRARLTEVTDGTGESYTQGLRIGEGDPRKKQVKNDPELIRKLLKDLGADPRVVYLEGADNSLDGYEVHGIEDLGVMVFGKFDKPNNAIFIMTIGQGSYFLRSLERRNNSKEQMTEDNKEIVLESSATKSELKNTEHVKYRVASRGLGKNIIDSIRELNPAIDEKMKDKKYKTKIDELVQDIKDDYDLRKEIG